MTREEILNRKLIAFDTELSKLGIKTGLAIREAMLSAMKEYAELQKSSSNKCSYCGSRNVATVEIYCHDCGSFSDC